MILQTLKKQITKNTNITPHIEITPDIAKELVINTTNNIKANRFHQRVQTEEYIDKYAEMMVQGKWGMSHQSIVLDDDMNVVDGLHRLKAVCKANVSVTFPVGISDQHCLLDVSNQKPKSNIDRLMCSGFFVGKPILHSQILEFRRFVIPVTMFLKEHFHDHIKGTCSSSVLNIHNIYSQKISPELLGQCMVDHKEQFSSAVNIWRPGMYVLDKNQIARKVHSLSMMNCVRAQIVIALLAGMDIDVITTFLYNSQHNPTSPEEHLFRSFILSNSKTCTAGQNRAEYGWQVLGFFRCLHEKKVPKYTPKADQKIEEYFADLIKKRYP